MSQQRKSAKGSQWVLLLLTIGASLTACRENAVNDLSPQDAQVYITNFDRSVNFNQYKTFSLPDSVVIESNDGYRPSLGALERRFTTNVATALTNRGFQRVAQGQTADLGVAVIRVTNQYTGVGTNPYSYYGNYWGGGVGGLGGYSPYYQSYYTYQVTDEYWEIQVVDLQNRPATTGIGQSQLKVIYDATIRGSDVTTTENVDTAITAIFNQSPYLKAVH
ncbi:DUF4136 domain-containing protein [Spirosoma areae]